jgi:hypothetical protein
MGDVLFVNKFLKALSEDNRENVREIEVGKNVVLKALDRSIINGTVDGFEEEDLILKIGSKSTFAINAKSIITINMKTNTLFKNQNGEGGVSG